MFRAYEPSQAPPRESSKLLSLSIPPHRARDVGEFHFFRENSLKHVRMGNLSEAINLLQGYVEGYALTVLKRYMAEVASGEWRATNALTIG